MRGPGARYDGVEIMGSEGYLLNQFLAPRTNKRTDAWGTPREAPPHARSRSSGERAPPWGRDFIIDYRMSMADLRRRTGRAGTRSSRWQRNRPPGATIINTGIGWYTRPGAHHRHVGAANGVRRHRNAVAQTVTIPVVASNRINMPQTAEQILARPVQLVSMARPLLSRPGLGPGAARRRDEINTCIACNQACLDHAFVHKTVSCLLNPRAGHETTVGARAQDAGDGGRSSAPDRPAVRGGRHRRLSAGTASRCSRPNDRIGGQFDMARDPRQRVRRDVALLQHDAAKFGVTQRLGVRGPAPPNLAGFDDVVLATGVARACPEIPGIEPSDECSPIAEAIYGGSSGRQAGP